MKQVRRSQVSKYAKDKYGVVMQVELGEGYVYFIYDVPHDGIFETHSVYVPRLNDLSLDNWKTEVDAFLTAIL